MKTSWSSFLFKNWTQGFSALIFKFCDFAFRLRAEWQRGFFWRRRLIILGKWNIAFDGQLNLTMKAHVNIKWRISYGERLDKQIRAESVSLEKNFSRERQISNNRNMFLVIAFFFSEIFHIHKSRSLVKDGNGYVLKITDSLLLSFCTQGFGPELQNPKMDWWYSSRGLFNRYLDVHTEKRFCRQWVKLIILLSVSLLHHPCKTDNLLSNFQTFFSIRLIK